MNTQLAHAESAPLVNAPKRRSSSKRVMIVLAVCMALQMTSFVMILPLLARRFTEIGAGVAALGVSAMASALAGTLAAPFMGALADRFGRRPVMLGSLAAYALAFTGYLFAASAPAFIVLRGLAGLFTAGLIPAVTGSVADLAPIDRRAQWIGIVNGGASIGWIAGPLLGGVLYDRWGHGVPFAVAASMAAVTFIAAYLVTPETRQGPVQAPGKPSLKNKHFRLPTWKACLQSLRACLPQSLSGLALLLCIYFTVMFAWAFIEPRFMFYSYDGLGWSSSMLGMVMSTYGIAMTLGEFGLSRLSDRLGRKPVILLGLVLFAAQFIGLAFARDYILIAIAFSIAGLGNALYDPALSAWILDIAPAKQQVRILGVKSTAGSLGNILGPALLVLFTPFLNAQGIFLVATGMVLLITLVFFFFQPRKVGPRAASEPVMADE